MSDEKDLVQHIANTLYCGGCWRKSLIAVSEPKYLVRLLKFYKGEYSNNTAAAKRIQKSIENELQKEINKAREEERNKKSRKLLISIMKQMKKRLKDMITNSYHNDDPQEAESIECALREFELIYRGELRKLKSGETAGKADSEDTTLVRPSEETTAKRRSQVVSVVESSPAEAGSNPAPAKGRINLIVRGEHGGFEVTLPEEVVNGIKKKGPLKDAKIKDDVDLVLKTVLLTLDKSYNLTKGR